MILQVLPVIGQVHVAEMLTLRYIDVVQIVEPRKYVRSCALYQKIY